MPCQNGGVLCAAASMADRPFAALAGIGRLTRLTGGWIAPVIGLVRGPCASIRSIGCVIDVPSGAAGAAMGWVIDAAG
jgi:hypothetical protein